MAHQSNELETLGALFAHLASAVVTDCVRPGAVAEHHLLWKVETNRTGLDGADARSVKEVKECGVKSRRQADLHPLYTGFEGHIESNRAAPRTQHKVCGAEAQVV